MRDCEKLPASQQSIALTLNRRCVAAEQPLTGKRVVDEECGLIMIGKQSGSGGAGRLKQELALRSLRGKMSSQSIVSSRIWGQLLTKCNLYAEQSHPDGARG